MLYDLVEQSKNFSQDSIRSSKLSSRKDGREEFFHMCYIANILPHPQKNRLIEIYGNNHYKELYLIAQEKKMPFYEWHGWIKQQLDDSLIKKAITRRTENFVGNTTFSSF